MKNEIDKLVMRAEKQVNKRKAFTLAEMMVVMLIMTIVLAMAAPLMTKRRAGDVSTDNPWRWVNDSTDEAYLIADHGMIGQKNEKLNGAIETNSQLLIKLRNSAASPITLKNESRYLNIAWNGGNGVYGTLRVGGPYTNTALGYRNTAFGIGTMTALNYGSSNTAFGDGTLTALTDGSWNTAVGQGALSSLTTGQNNIGIGYQALSANQTASHNIAIGNGALKANTVGAAGIAIGPSALEKNTRGDFNIAIGMNALMKHTGTSYNTVANNIAIGKDALANSTVSTYNVAIGDEAMYGYKTSGSMGYNIAIGKQALYSDTLKNTTTSSSIYNNIAIGQEALYTNGVTNNNVAVGYRALMNNKTGNSNVAVGTLSMRDNVSGINNVAIGEYALSSNQKGGYNIALGSSSCGSVKSSYKTCIGYGSGPSSSADAAKEGNNDKIIYLGDANTTVYIPGNLVVDKNVGLATVDGLVALRSYYQSDRYFGHVHGTTLDRLFLDYEAPSTFSFINKVHTSDRRLKNISGESTASLDKIRELKVFNYTFKKDENKTPHVGVMAQDLQKVFPDAVTKDKDGYLMIRMEDMFYSAINAIKELDNLVQGVVNEIKVVYEKITGLDTRIQALEKENKQLKETNKHLEKQIADINKRLKKLEK